MEITLGVNQHSIRECCRLRAFAITIDQSCASRGGAEKRRSRVGSRIRTESSGRDVKFFDGTAY